jgi:hypothetical protein
MRGNGFATIEASEQFVFLLAKLLHSQLLLALKPHCQSNIAGLNYNQALVKGISQRHCQPKILTGIEIITDVSRTFY